MAALTASRLTPHRTPGARNLPLAAGAKVFQGSIVALSVATGYATKGAVATTLRGAGVAEATVDNTSGADGALSVSTRIGVWQFQNSAAGDQITRADIGNSCYIVDDQTVAKTNGGGTRSVAGVIYDVDANGVWVNFS